MLLAVFALCSGALAAEFEQSADSWLDDEPEFLRVDEAFVLSTEVAADGAILAYWEIADGYYLYRHRFNFQNRVSADDSSSPLVLSAAEIPPGKRKVDEFWVARQRSRRPGRSTKGCMSSCSTCVGR